jgi:ATP-dependent RNA helicase RhlE
VSFSTLGLRQELLRAVADAGYTTPTPIQQQAIPAVLAGRDLQAAAQTGTGKTAAFVLPMLQNLLATPATNAAQPVNRTARRPVRALILTPTRELAVQVAEDLRGYGRYLSLRSVTIYGGVGYGPQIEALRRGVDIVVATPGRLLDHIQQRNLDLSRAEVVVLDEGDRMLDMGFINDIKRILALLPAKRQSLLFSATFSEDIRRIAGAFLKNPVEIDVSPRNIPTELVEQQVHWVDRDKKRALLSHLVSTNEWKQALVFTRTKHGADRLALQLERDGLRTAAIHGDKSQGQRLKALEDFKRGRVRILVATDVASRGLDIERLPHVVNYELPNAPEDYVHRIGRTGRAGREGAAISLVSREEMDQLRDIQRLLNRTLPASIIEGFAPSIPMSIPAARRSEPARRPQGRRPGRPAGHTPQRAAHGAHRPGESGAGRAAESAAATTPPRRGMKRLGAGRPSGASSPRRFAR